MPYRFKKHYTLAEARTMLPKVSEWLDDLARLREEHEKLSQRVANLVSAQSDVGGESVNNSLKVLFAMQSIYGVFKQNDIHLKDAERGLIDFPRAEARVRFFSAGKRARRTSATARTRCWL